MIQDNLKKAFLRGITSMNMEAMGIFGTSSEMTESKHETFERNVSEQLNNFDNSMIRTPNNESNLNQSPRPSTSVIMNKSKLESKDHKWKEAPIMGYAEKDEVEEPRAQMIKPTSEAKVIRVIDGKSSVDTTQKDSRYRKPGATSDYGNRIESGKRKT
jgi:hypothetical protein